MEVVASGKARVTATATECVESLIAQPPGLAVVRGGTSHAWQHVLSCQSDGIRSSLQYKVVHVTIGRDPSMHVAMPKNGPRWCAISGSHTRSYYDRAIECADDCIRLFQPPLAASRRVSIVGREGRQNDVLWGSQGHAIGKELGRPSNQSGAAVSSIFGHCCSEFLRAGGAFRPPSGIMEDIPEECGCAALAQGPVEEWSAKDVRRWFEYKEFKYDSKLAKVDGKVQEGKRTGVCEAPPACACVVPCLLRAWTQPRMDTCLWPLSKLHACNLSGCGETSCCLLHFPAEVAGDDGAGAGGHPPVSTPCAHGALRVPHTRIQAGRVGEYTWAIGNSG
eukprot:366377-Chlamydomonas_euryale.AAC.1